MGRVNIRVDGIYNPKYINYYTKKGSATARSEFKMKWMAIEIRLQMKEWGQSIDTLYKNGYSDLMRKIIKVNHVVDNPAKMTATEKEIVKCIRNGDDCPLPFERKLKRANKMNHAGARLRHKISTPVDSAISIFIMRISKTPNIFFHTY